MNRFNFNYAYPYPRGENMITEKCPVDPTKTDVYETDSEGIEHLVYCGNRGY